MSLPRKVITSAMLAAIVAGMAIPALVRGKDEAASAPASAPATAKSDKRTAEAIIQDLDATSEEVRKNLGALPTLLDDAKRAEIAPKAIPPLKKMIGYLQELKDVTKDAEADQTKFQLLSILSLLGDADSDKTLAELAADKNPDIALQATLSTTIASWWKNSNKPEEQKKILATMSKMYADKPDNDAVQGTLMVMSNLGAANASIRKEIKAIQGAPEEGKPIAFAGPTIDGKKFSTADMKGKVLVVDFWATWCGPCRAELPNLIKTYQKYHEKGVEFVGVSLDQTADDLKDFLKKNPDLSWTQVFDEKQPIAKKYGIQAIPTMYLIDQEGNLVTTEARGKLDELLPKLLADKGAASQPAPK